VISASLPQTSVVSRQTCRDGRPRLSRSSEARLLVPSGAYARLQRAGQPKRCLQTAEKLRDQP